MIEQFVVDIQAPPETVWGVLTDVERWPEWTGSVRSATRLDAGEFRVGSKARLRQPRLVPVVWKVTDLEPGRSFTWVAHTVGVTSVADHRLDAGSADRTRVTLRIEQTGPLGRLAGALFSGLSRRYLRMEANGLKQRSEQVARGAARPDGAGDGAE